MSPARIAFLVENLLPLVTLLYPDLPPDERRRRLARAVMIETRDKPPVTDPE
jgi:hypothetical protein